MSATPRYSVNGSNLAEVSLISCQCGEVNSSNPNGEITGNVTLSLRNVTFVREGTDPIFATGFTGKVANYLRNTPFTFATRPPNPVDGLMISVSDADLTSKLWGDPVTAGGGTNSHALLRWNAGTSNWTLVGK